MFSSDKESPWYLTWQLQTTACPTDKTNHHPSPNRPLLWYLLMPSIWAKRRKRTQFLLPRNIYNRLSGQDSWWTLSAHKSTWSVFCREDSWGCFRGPQPMSRSLRRVAWLPGQHFCLICICLDYCMISLGSHQSTICESLFLYHEKQYKKCTTRLENTHSLGCLHLTSCLVNSPSLTPPPTHT